MTEAELKAAQERVAALEDAIRLAVDLIPPAVLQHTQAGAQLVAAIEKAELPGLTL